MSTETSEWKQVYLVYLNTLRGNHVIIDSRAKALAAQVAVNQRASDPEAQPADIDVLVDTIYTSLNPEGQAPAKRQQDMQQCVYEFHKAGAGPHPEFPSLDHARSGLRQRLIAEEANEVIDALQGNSMVAIAKELADLLYVTFGTAVEYGIDMNPIFLAVHESNMTKCQVDDQGNPKLVRREDGKVLKPDSYVPAESAVIEQLYAQWWSEDVEPAVKVEVPNDDEQATAVVEQAADAASISNNTETLVEDSEGSSAD